MSPEMDFFVSSIRAVEGQIQAMQREHLQVRHDLLAFQGFEPASQLQPAPGGESLESLELQEALQMASERQEQLQEAHDRHENELRALRASARVGLEGVTTCGGLDRKHVLDMRAEVAVLAGAVRELSDRVDRMS